MWKRPPKLRKRLRHLNVLLFVVLAGCATVPLDLPKAASTAVEFDGTTHFGREVLEWESIHGDKSGFFPLFNGMDALGARLDLAEKAEHSIDLQYFLMKNDTAGLVLAQALLQAADRGVRVRFLLDDIFTTAPDEGLLLINQHPNIEVRLFNPVSRRGFYGLNFVGNFSRANRRMHNKSYTVDNAVSIVGGRNIANEYFDLDGTAVFADFDAVAFGEIAREISATFDVYWNHQLAIPIEQLSSPKKSRDLATVRAERAGEANEIYQSTYGKAFSSELMQQLVTDEEPLYPAYADVLADDPEKLLNRVSSDFQQVAQDLDRVLQGAEKEIIIITPYYVPGKPGIDYARNVIDRGLRLVIVTNSLASNNHVPVHSGYSRYRKDALRAGVELYETRADAGDFGEEDGPDAFTLHTKLILIDRKYLFVGSLNMDPRSIDINAEMGILIHSIELTGEMADVLEEVIPHLAYRLVLNDDNRLEWHGLIDEKSVVETREPQASAWLRFKAWFLKIAPESQL